MDAEDPETGLKSLGWGRRETGVRSEGLSTAKVSPPTPFPGSVDCKEKMASPLRTRCKSSDSAGNPE
jgi:hypothetical protein